MSSRGAVSTSSRIAAAIAGFGAFATRARRRARRARPRCRRRRSAMSARETSLKTTRSAFFVSSIARLRSRPSSPRSAPKVTSTWPGRLRSPSEPRDVGGRLELDRPRLVALRALARERLGGPVVGDRGGEQRDVDVARARARRRASPRRSASGSSRRRAGPARRGSRRAGRPRRRAGAPPRRARRPSGPTSGCRRSAPRRAARACRRR